MLPRVIQENSVQPFKFWFSGSLQDGVHFQNDLYYRLKKTSVASRSHAYHLAYKLSQRGADVFLTVSQDHYSLWANLRNQKVAAFSLSNKLSLPSADTLLQ